MVSGHNEIAHGLGGYPVGIAVEGVYEWGVKANFIGTVVDHIRQVLPAGFAQQEFAEAIAQEIFRVNGGYVLGNAVIEKWGAAFEAYGHAIAIFVMHEVGEGYAIDAILPHIVELAVVVMGNEAVIGTASEGGGNDGPAVHAGAIAQIDLEPRGEGLQEGAHGVGFAHFELFEVGAELDEFKGFELLEQDGLRHIVVPKEELIGTLAVEDNLDAYLGCHAHKRAMGHDGGVAKGFFLYLDVMRYFIADGELAEIAAVHYEILLFIELYNRIYVFRFVVLATLGLGGEYVNFLIGMFGKYAGHDRGVYTAG